MADVANLPPDVLTDHPVRGRILIIDDEPDIRESLEALLAGENYQVELAPNATEGQRRMEVAARPDDAR
jgi:DNA-binding response OmpR family regulator